MRWNLKTTGLVLFCLGLGNAHGFEYEDLKRLIEEKKLHTIADVLKNLPEEYRENFTLLRKSRSLQEASPQFPRAILFGNDAKFLLAFNGDPKQRNYQTLETIQFRESTDEFEFHSITFPKEAGKQGEVHFSEKNPALCSKCHRNDPRPNWEKYFTWNGAYGEVDDVPEKTELEDLKNFLVGLSSHDRYKNLVINPGSDNGPYEIQRRGRLRFRPNLRLLNFTAAYNSRRVFRMIRQDPQYGKFSWLFALSRLQCPEMTLSTADELKKIFGPKGAGPLGSWTEPTLKNTAAYILRNLGLKERDVSTMFLKPDPPVDPYFFYIGITAGVDYKTSPLLEFSDQIMGQMFKRWIKEYTELGPYYELASFNQARYAADPKDLSYSLAADKAIEDFDMKTMKGACPILYRKYVESMGHD
jgi:hypothetical protein